MYKWVTAVVACVALAGVPCSAAAPKAPVKRAERALSPIDQRWGSLADLVDRYWLQAGDHAVIYVRYQWLTRNRVMSFSGMDLNGLPIAGRIELDPESGRISASQAYAGASLHYDIEANPQSYTETTLVGGKQVRLTYQRSSPTTFLLTVAQLKRKNWIVTQEATFTSISPAGIRALGWIPQDPKAAVLAADNDRFDPAGDSDKIAQGVGRELAGLTASFLANLFGPTRREYTDEAGVFKLTPASFTRGANGYDVSIDIQNRVNTPIGISGVRTRNGRAFMTLKGGYGGICQAEASGTLKYVEAAAVQDEAVNIASSLNIFGGSGTIRINFHFPYSNCAIPFQDDEPISLGGGLMSQANFRLFLPFKVKLTR